MRDYVLVCDSTGDLPVDVVKETGVKIIPFSYTIEDETFYYYLDERDDIKGFYDRLRAGDMPITSQINPTMYKEFFKTITDEGKDVLYMCFSSGLSGSYQSASLGADMLMEENPDAKVVIVDTLSASIGEGLFMYLAAKKKSEGMGMEELVSWLNENRQNVRHWFMVEDLFHLSRGGRLSAVGAVVGSALKIKPILSVDEEGKLFVKAKTRGTAKALDYIIGKAKEEGGNPENIIGIIGHADDIEKAEKLKAMAIEAGIKEENLMLSSIGPIIGTHVGAGMAAMAFFAQ